MSIDPWRISIGVVGLVCLGIGIVNVSPIPINPWVAAVAQGALLAALYIELMIKGGLVALSKNRLNAYMTGVGVYFIGRYGSVPADVAEMLVQLIPIVLSGLLVWSGFWELRPARDKSKPK